MNLIDDFFIIIWGEKANEDLRDKIENLELHVKQRALFCEALAVILCVNSKNFEKFCQVGEFGKITEFLGLKVCENVSQIKALQFYYLRLLNSLGKSYSQEISSHINSLSKAKLISKENEEKILSLLELIEDKIEEDKKEIIQPKTKLSNPTDYKEYISFFQDILKDLNPILESDNLKNQSQLLSQKIQNQSFSVGITGVMNAGKSTMLNALLGKEILGTSVVPETANLTIIKYAKKSHAKVNFWTKDEWERIEKSASLMPSIKKFVEQSKEAFGESLDEFIQEKTKSIDINTSDLSSYTSTKQSNLTCNLVKRVELYEDLDFVKDGVNIVDTPGLDDPVIQREEITKDYLSQCDVMIHLMNANQSATQKDVDFIIDSLIYGHITRLLIVITRIDTISEDELKEVIAYTKRSIQNRLRQDNKEARFDSIISKIDFLPIAGKLALMHRIGQEKEALRLGYDLKKTGILDIERYLQKVLFGAHSEKNQLLLQSIHKELGSIISNALDRFSFEMESLSKSSDELERDFKALKEKNKANLELIEKINLQISEARYSLEDYFKTLNKFIDDKLNSLKNITIGRLCDDVSYEWRKNKKKPAQNRIKSMVETSMKDGIVDIIRDYRYEFSKRMQSELEQIASIDTKLFDGSPNGDFNSREYFEKNFGSSFLSGSYALTHKRILDELKKVKKAQIEGFSVALDGILKEDIKNLKDKINASLEDINQNLLNTFLQRANKPTRELKASMEEKEKILQKQINLIQKDNRASKERLGKLKEKISTLKDLKESLKENKI